MLKNGTTVPKTYGHLGVARKSRGCFPRLSGEASYTTYRHDALKLKALLLLLIIPINSNTYASMSLIQENGLFRLEGPQKELLSVSVSEPFEGEGPCQGKQVIDLVLSFENEGKSWATDNAPPRIVDRKSICQTRLIPQENGMAELKISYVVKPKTRLRWVKYPTQNNWIVDFWIDAAKQYTKEIKDIASKDAPQKREEKVDSKFQSYFEDQKSWEMLLGSSVTANDFERPELKRFRLKSDKEINLGVESDSLERRKLVLPAFAFPRLESKIVFPEKKLEKVEFSVDEIIYPTDSTMSAEQTERIEKGTLKGLNFIVNLVNKGDWLRAQTALDVLEKSEFRQNLPLRNPKYLAWKGVIYKETGRQVGDEKLKKAGLDIWRKGLQLGTGQKKYQNFLDFMALELTREFYEAHQSYLNLGFLSWAEGFKWGTEVEQRFAYLRGESYLDLGFFDDAKSYFTEYFYESIKTPLTSYIDRRLVPKGGIWIGDIDFIRGRYEDAFRGYNKTITALSTGRQFSIEGTLYPNLIREYPQVLLNRAQAALHLGLEKSALKDLRAFIYVAANHPHVGIAYYKISETLARLGAPPEQIQDTWRECIFRSPKMLGGRLCAAQKASYEFSSNNKNDWSRNVGVIEKIGSELSQSERQVFSDLQINDLKAYASLLFADAFIRVKEPFQALSRLDPTDKYEMSPYLRKWINEYRMVSLAGTFENRIREGKFKEVISEYELRRKSSLLNFVRPSILWRVAAAYYGLGLEKDALTVVNTGIQVQESMKEFSARPYDVEAVDWSLFSSNISLKLLREKKLPPEIVKKSVDRIPDNRTEKNARLAEFYRLVEDSKTEEKVLEKIFESGQMNPAQLYRYSDLLKKQQKFPQLDKTILRMVAPWLAEAKKKFDESHYPGPELVMELFEAYERAGRHVEAIDVLEYILKIDEKHLSAAVTKPMVAYKMGVVQKNIGRFDDSRQSFAKVIELDPNGVWGKLAASAQKDLDTARATTR